MNYTQDSCSDNTLEITFDIKGYETKPDASEIKSIFKRISGINLHSHTPEEIRSLVLSGHTFVPGRYEGPKKNENWRAQQIVALDFDGMLPLDEFWKIIAKYEIEPFFVYKSYSHGKKNGDCYRALFACDQIIEDVEIWKWILILFKKMFEIPISLRKVKTDICYADIASFTLSQMFFGTTSENEVNFSPENQFNPMNLYEAILYQIKSEDPKHWKSKFARVFEKQNIEIRYASSCEFDCVGISSCVSSFKQEGFSHFFRLPENFERNFAFLRFYFSGESFYSKETDKLHRNHYSRTEIDSSQNDSQFFDEIEARGSNIQNSSPSSSQNISRNADSKIRRTKDLTDVDKEMLKRECRFHREYVEGIVRWKRDQRLRYFSNLSRYRNITHLVNEGFENFNALRGDGEPYGAGSHQRLLDSVRKGEFTRPSKCANFCPYAATCNPNGHPTDKLGKRRGEIRRIADYTPAPEVSLEEARRMLREKLDLVMAQNDDKVYVIVAETSIGKTTEILRRDLDGCMVAFKTHALKEEAYASLSEERRKGVYRWVEAPKLPGTLQEELDARYRLGYGNTLDLFKQARSFVTVRSKPYWKKAIDEYIQATKDIQFQSCIFATHKKALHVLENKNIHTVIFDENPINTLKEALQNSRRRHLESTPERIILPKEKKIVLLTADKDIPELKSIVAPERIEIIQLPPIMKKGNLYMNPQRSYSKHCINQDQERFVDEVKDAVEKYKLDGVITHLDFREILEENGITVFAHFGAVEGTNQFSGRNIGIFGVPHLPPEAIKQAQNLFGIKPGTDLKYTERSIQRNGYEFDFYTASTDNEIAEIGLSSIENQLNQSIGRSRLQIFDSNVYFFGNFVPADYVKFMAQ